MNFELVSDLNFLTLRTLYPLNLLSIQMAHEKKLESSYFIKYPLLKIVYRFTLDS